jgi:hypothetical protein
MESAVHDRRRFHPMRFPMQNIRQERFCALPLAGCLLKQFVLMR